MFIFPFLAYIVQEIANFLAISHWLIAHILLVKLMLNFPILRIAKVLFQKHFPFLKEIPSQLVANEGFPTKTYTGQLKIPINY